MNYQTKLINIKEELKSLGITCFLDAIPSVTDVSIIISNYSPSNNSPPVSIAFSITNDGDKFNPKCWITKEKANTITYHLKYKEFRYENREFHPYSVALSDVSVNATSIGKLCSQLYDYIDFSNV